MNKVKFYLSAKTLMEEHKKSPMHPPGSRVQINHFILNDIMSSEEGNSSVQAQCVDLSINLLLTQTNTHQSNYCFGPGPCVVGKGGCSRCTCALAAANFSHLILSVTIFS